MKKLTFAVNDGVLLTAIEKGIVPYLPHGDIAFYQGLPGSWPRSLLLVVGVSGIPDGSDIDTIMCARDRNQSCGVIALSPSPVKWGMLARYHEATKFTCFVAAGVETSYARRMIPGIDILSDIGDLVLPGKQIAEYLWKVVEQSERLGPIPRPYASCG